MVITNPENILLPDHRWISIFLDEMLIGGSTAFSGIYHGS